MPFSKRGAHGLVADLATGGPAGRPGIKIEQDPKIKFLNLDVYGPSGQPGRLRGVIRHTRTYFHSPTNVCDRFLERTKWSRSGAPPGRELFIAPLALGAHGGAKNLVPLLPASPCGPDTPTRNALGQRHAEKCAMRRTLSGGFGTVSGGSRDESGACRDHWLWIACSTAGTRYSFGGV